MKTTDMFGNTDAQCDEPVNKGCASWVLDDNVHLQSHRSRPTTRNPCAAVCHKALTSHVQRFLQELWEINKPDSHNSLGSVQLRSSVRGLIDSSSKVEKTCQADSATIIIQLYTSLVT